MEGYTVDFEKLPERLKGPEFTAVLTDGYNTTVATLDILRDYAISMPHGSPSSGTTTSNLPTTWRPHHCRQAADAGGGATAMTPA